MNNTLDKFELKGEQRRKLVIGFILAMTGFLFAPFAILTIKGILGLLVTLVICITAVQLAPVFGAKMKIMKIKALKAIAAANPIEYLEGLYGEKMQALDARKENLKRAFAALQKFAGVMKEHDQKYPGKTSQYAEQFSKMKRLLNLQGTKFQEAQKELSRFRDFIDEQKADWEVAQAAAETTKLAKVGEDFQNRLMQDAAFDAIQNGLNTAFAELDLALLDEPVQNVAVSVSAPAEQKSLPEKTASSLELEVDMDRILNSSTPIEAEFVPIKRKSRI